MLICISISCPICRNESCRICKKLLWGWTLKGALTCSRSSGGLDLSIVPEGLEFAEAVVTNSGVFMGTAWGEVFAVWLGMGLDANLSRFAEVKIL